MLGPSQDELVNDAKCLTLPDQPEEKEEKEIEIMPEKEDSSEIKHTNSVCIEQLELITKGVEARKRMFAPTRTEAVETAP